MLEAVLSLAPRLSRYLLGGVMRALKDPGDLLADPLQRLANRGLGRTRRLQLGDQLTGLLDIGINRQAVVPAERYGEVGVHGCDRVIRQGIQWSGDLLEDRMLRRG